MPPTLISAGTATRSRRDGNYTIYTEPRISANQLAQFLVSDPSKQESIVANSRRVSRIQVANYQHARSSLTRSHDQNGINPDLLNSAIQRLEANPGNDDFDRTCLDLSVRSLRRLAPLVGKIDCEGMRINRPQRGFDHLLIEGVRVSIQPDIVFSFNHRGGVRFGGVLVNFANGAGSALSKAAGKYSAGDYAAYLVYQFLAIQFASQGGPRYQNCFAVDVFRDSLYSAPASFVMMLRNVEAACRNIARQWTDLELEEL